MSFNLMKLKNDQYHLFSLQSIARISQIMQWYVVFSTIYSPEALTSLGISYEYWPKTSSE